MNVQIQEKILDVLIVGAGFSGVCAGYHLLKRGITDFMILEKTDGVGGTWYKNRYPGAACDVPSHFYCFSFAPNPNWSHVFSPQAEIQAYIEKCAHDFGLLPHIRFNTDVSQFTFNEVEKLWTVTLPNEEVLRARHLIMGSGGLNIPNTPDIPGLETFAGPAFHTAQWRSDVEMADQNVVVIGSAASAVQAVPELARKVKHLTMFQRTANYIAPRKDRAYTDAEKATFQKSALRLKLHRFKIYLRFEYLLSSLFQRKSLFRKGAQQKIQDDIRASITDKTLAEKLVPDYEMGCKRILISDDFYPALERPNVSVNTDGIDHIEPDAVIDKTGKRIAADVLVLATGFDLHKQMISIDLVGRGGQSLRARWHEAANAYKGCMVDGFPNAYFVTGPNTGVGSTSIVHMIEAQMQFIMQCIDLSGRTKLIEPTPQAVQADDLKTQQDLQNTVWAGSCKSWYKDENGRIHTLYPKAARFFRKDRKTLKQSEFLISDREN